MLFESDDDRIANEYFESINDLIGVVSVGLGITALQYEHPIPVAVICAIATLLWTLSKGREYMTIVKHYLPPGTRWFVYAKLFWRLRVYLFGMTFLLSVAIGITTKCGLYGLFGYACSTTS